MTELFSGADLALARRIEAGHAHSAMSSIPGVSVEAVAGGWAIFHALDSPVTQAISVGMHGVVAPAELDQLESFFHKHSSPAVIDLCTLADPSLTAMIAGRGYAIREISNVLVRRLNRRESFSQAQDIVIEAIAPHELRAWARMTLQGFAGTEEVPEGQEAMLTSINPNLAFYGSWQHSRNATAAMAIHDELATLFGDATLVHARGHGLQIALIHHRLHVAAQNGCDLATASVLPGSISHRNYERAGFQLIYARVMVARAANIGIPG